VTKDGNAFQTRAPINGKERSPIVVLRVGETTSAGEDVDRSRRLVPLSSSPVLAFRCLKGLAPTYLTDSLQHVADLPGRQRLRSASSADLAVPQTRLQTVGDRALCVAAAKTWNSLPSKVTLSATLSTFKHKLKTYIFFTVISRHVMSPHFLHIVVQ